MIGKSIIITTIFVTFWCCWIQTTTNAFEVSRRSSLTTSVKQWQQQQTIVLGAHSQNEILLVDSRSISSATTRRTVLQSLIVGPSLLFLTQNAQAAPIYDDSVRKTIVITGCNSGIGLNAAERMAARGHKIVLACRTLAKAQLAENEIRVKVPEAKLIPLECDLASLESVRAFSKAVVQEVGTIDVLCLNAGLARDTSAKEVLRTKEGFELTIGTNHLGHFLLANLLLSNINKENGRIVVTASGVHDPDSPGGAQGSKATLGDLAGLESGPNFDMVDGGAFDADKAYKDSKLCNVFFTRELQRRLDNTMNVSQEGSGANKITVNCFNPGLIVGTGLFRDQNPLFTKAFDFIATDLVKVGETTSWGGGTLEFVALDEKLLGGKGGFYLTSPPGSSKYGDEAFGDQFTISDVSKEAQDIEKGKKLWQLSEALVGL